MSEAATEVRRLSMAQRLAQWKESLFDPVDAASLGVFRIMFGLILSWEVYRYFTAGWIYDYYILPNFHFKYFGFEWVQAWPGKGMYVHFAVLAVLGLLLTFGLFYRVTTVLFFLGFSYVFLLDQSRYLNHFYLTAVFLFLLIWVGANRWASLDRLFFQKGQPAVVPYWQLWLFRAQMFIVYLYAGIAKLNPDWIRAIPIKYWVAHWAEEHKDVPIVGALAAHEWAGWFAAYFGLAFDLSIGFLLIWRRTRMLGILLAFAFHTGNNFLFHIGIFPFFAMAATLLFLEPDWPRRVLAWLGRVRGKRGWLVGEPLLGRFYRTAAEEGLPTRSRFSYVPPPPARRQWVLAALGVYMAYQILMPLRHWLYPGDVAWTEEGHRWSWRMKLRDKEGRIAVAVIDPTTGKSWDHNPHDDLLPWQFDEMVGRPDMLIQYAHWLRDRYRREKGIADPQVWVSVLCSLNGRPERVLIQDPMAAAEGQQVEGADLAHEQRSLLPAPWVTRSYEESWSVPESQPGIEDAAPGAGPAPGDRRAPPPPPRPPLDAESRTIRR